MNSNQFYIQNGKIIQTDDYVADSGNPPGPAPNPNIIGGRLYKSIIINGQEWLAENLDFRWDGLGSDYSFEQSLENAVPSAVYYNRDEETYGINGKNYGLLYNFAAAKYLDDHRDTLIPGWRVPTSDDFTILYNFLVEEMSKEDPHGASAHYCGKELMSTTEWTYECTTWTDTSTGKTYTNTPTDSYGFNAVPSGLSFGGNTSWEQIGNQCLYWTAEISTYKASHGTNALIAAPGRFTPSIDRDYPIYTRMSIRLFRNK